MLLHENRKQEDFNAKKHLIFVFVATQKLSRVEKKIQAENSWRQVGKENEKNLTEKCEELYLIWRDRIKHWEFEWDSEKFNVELRSK